MTDEETLERAFLSALRKHFKKPGPWLPFQTLEATAVWPDAKGIPAGQVWEVYARLNVGTQLYRNGAVWMNTSLEFAETWYPMNSTWIYNGAAAEFVHYCPCEQGWTLSGGETLMSPAAYLILARRRFDLET